MTWVLVKIVEGDKERIQPYEGECIARKGGGMNESFTVRRVSYGVGMERVFPLNSPRITKIEVLRKGKVRRAKLYYLRGKRGKAARIRELQVARPVKNTVKKPAQEEQAVTPEPEQAPADES